MEFRIREGPDDLLSRFSHLFSPAAIPGPVLDLACGGGHNGIFLAASGLDVVLADRSEDALAAAERAAQKAGVQPKLWRVDLEREGANPLQANAYGAVVVFRYLHRLLIPCIRKALRSGGLLVYETFTEDQIRFGRPRNPAHLLKPGELAGWFADWEMMYAFEGIAENPDRAVSRIVCRKP